MKTPLLEIRNLHAAIAEDGHRILNGIDLVVRRGWRGKVAKTVSTTGLVDRLCARYGLPLVETPVGFQDISIVLLDEDGLMGGEESGGMSVRGHVPQGDGILLSLLAMPVALPFAIMFMRSPV